MKCWDDHGISIVRPLSSKWSCISLKTDDLQQMDFWVFWWTGAGNSSFQCVFPASGSRQQKDFCRNDDQNAGFRCFQAMHLANNRIYEASWEDWRREFRFTMFTALAFRQQMDFCSFLRGFGAEIPVLRYFQPLHAKSMDFWSFLKGLEAEIQVDVSFPVSASGQQMDFWRFLRGLEARI